MGAQLAIAEPTRLDRLIGWLDPQRGMRRLAARTMLQRAYEAASPRDTWKPRRPGASADADHFSDAATMRAKARSLVQNVPYARASLDALVANVIGTGIVPVWEGAQSAEAQALWVEWVKVADADGKRDFYGLQDLAYRTMEQDGEVLIRYRWRRAEDGLPVPLQLQLLEVDWLDTSRQQGAVRGNRIVNGIEFDVLGQKVAYWLWDQHPGDITLRRGMKTQSRRVPASLIQHLYRAERPGQGRGFTRFAPVIASMRDMRLLEDAELQRKNLEARLGVLVSGDASLFVGPPDKMTPEEAKRTGQIGELPSGGITQVPPGSTITTVAPNASPGYTDYVKLQLHLITAGFGVPYEEATGDMTEVNFSSAKVRQTQFRRQCEQTQWLELVPNMCVPVSAMFVRAAELVGKLNPRRVSVGDWSTPKWDSPNPKDDVEASIRLIGSGQRSISELIRQSGYRPDKVFPELEKDIAELKRIGVWDALMFLLRGNSPQSPEAATAGAASAAK